MTANGSPLFCYAMIISLQKLIHVLKSNTADFLKNTETQQQNTNQNTKKTTGINWIKKDFLINSENM